MMFGTTNRVVSLLLAVGLLFVGVPAGAIESALDEATPGVYAHPHPHFGVLPHSHPHAYDDEARGLPSGVLAAKDSLELETHGGYSSEYIFGMTKGIMRSTLTPALKPVVLVLTVPLDIAFLPFAAIGGFFR